MAELQKTYPHRSWQHISSDIRKKDAEITRNIN
ncbi:hypothetical protein T11_5808 [Trichinella zimbabwensis]|uniref:Uncharacterized protein n=1 Tax=Trichinella zimbabwensis TaxID=268475 RepID=A0A0V1DRB9_9BILA|nr:hypothetical protein T11_5808 [Trichinella zimbabwensis]